MAIKYIPFYTPLEGQAVLGNFIRTKRLLDYRGNRDVVPVIERGMVKYDMLREEPIGSNPDGNMVVRGDCVSTCAYLRDQGIRVDLVYIDPPFASGADYAKKIYLRHNPALAEKIEETEKELSHDDMKSFEEKMYGDIWDKEKYLNWMYENLCAIKSVMSDEASIFVHLDWNIGHYVKILMDEIFGEENFANEIVWHYYNKMQGNVNRFASNHDTIFYYHIGSEFNFTTVKEEREKKTKQIKRVWDSEGQKLVNAKDENGKVIYQDSDSFTIDDVWRLPMLQPAGLVEPMEYGTQKPEALLRRIIESASNEGMLVADFFAGSGVTAAVAHKLGRKFVTCDIGLNSIETTRDRLKNLGAEFDVMKVDDGVSLFRNPAQTMDRVREIIPNLKEDIGLS